MSPSQFQSVTEQEPLYQLWRGEPLSPVELAMLALVIKHWRAGTPIERDVAVFELVQAGFPYKEAHLSRYALNGRRPPAISIEQNDIAVPKLAGLIELGDAECVADLKLLARIVQTLRTLYRPDRRQLSLEEVCSASDISVGEGERMAPFTSLYGKGSFQLEGHVLGWTSLSEFLNDRMGAGTSTAVHVEQSSEPELEMDFVPSMLAWRNLGPFAEALLELTPMTVLVGANDVGKTSALRVIDLVRNLAARGLDVGDQVQPPPTWPDLVRTGASEIELGIGGVLRALGKPFAQAQWETTIVTNPRVAVKQESLVLDDHRKEVALAFGAGTWRGIDRTEESVHLRSNQLALRMASNPQKHAALIAMKQGLCRWVAATDYTPLDLPQLDTEIVSVIPIPAIDMKLLNEAVAAVLGPVKLVVSRQKIFFGDRRGRIMPLQFAPSGVEQVVAVLMALLQSRPPALLALDEIENHLHANVLERLLEVMRGFTSRTRIVLATHSSTVLRTMSPEEVRVVIAEGETSTIVRADQDPRFSTLVETGELGELLQQGYFAGGL
jgi:hypothetical protein